MIEVIGNEQQYRSVMAQISRLIDSDPPVESADGKLLGVLAVLARDYEARQVPNLPPNPIAAIFSRMDQLGITRRELIPIIGSRSKVSEVLSGSRPLSLGMIRSLNAHLGIPFASLIAEQPPLMDEEKLDWERFPTREAVKRRWFALSKQRPSVEVVQHIWQEYFAQAGGMRLANAVLLKTDRVRLAAGADRFALAAWAARVHVVGSVAGVRTRYSPQEWDATHFRELRSLSRFDVGPSLVQRFLLERGVVFVVEPHLPRTRLDGAAMMRSDGVPIVAMTLRHDRLDNFWFTLFHELMHVRLHLFGDWQELAGGTAFFDDLDLDDSVSELERQADLAARDALVPLELWERSAAKFVAAPETVSQLAEAVGVADAVVAGRVRKERGNFRILSGLIGSGRVRVHFPEQNDGPDGGR